MRINRLMIPAILAALAASLTSASLSAQPSTPADQIHRGYYRFPAVHGDAIVFTSEGDLWSVSIHGGAAQRLTTSPGMERFASISPDGKSIAFQANYEGPNEVYTMPVTGGLPERRTWDGGATLERGRDTLPVEPRRLGFPVVLRYLCFVDDDHRGRHGAERDGEIGLSELLDVGPLHDRGDELAFLVGALLETREPLLHIADPHPQGCGEVDVIEVGADDSRQRFWKRTQPFESILECVVVCLGEFGLETFAQVLVFREAVEQI